MAIEEGKSGSGGARSSRMWGWCAARPWLLLIVLLLAVNGELLAGRTLSIWGQWYSGPRPDWTTTNDPEAASNSLALDGFERLSLRQGEFPFWNPLQGIGQPFSSNGLSAAFHPLVLIKAVLPAAWFDLSLLLGWGLMAIFLYLYLRELEVGVEGALAGSAALLVGGQTQLNLPLRELLAGAMTFPLLLYGIERAVRDPSWRWRHLVLALGVYGAVTGHPETFFAGLVAVSVYGLVRVLLARPSRWRALGALLPGALGGLAISAPAWLPFAHYLRRCATTHGDALHGLDKLRPEAFATFLFPFMWGRVQQSPLGRIEGWTWNRSFGWTQALCLFLALVALLEWRRVRARGTIALWLLFAVPIAKFLGVPGVQWLGALPGLRDLKLPSYAAFIPELAVCGLVGVGLSSLRGARPAALARAVVIWLFLAGGVYAAGVSVVPWSAFHTRESLPFLWAGAGWAVLAPIGLVLAVWRRPSNTTASEQRRGERRSSGAGKAVWI